MKKIFKQIIPVILCLTFGLFIAGCNKPNVTYYLNKNSIEYVIGSNFSNLDLYLIDSKNENNKVLVTKDMFVNQAIFTTECNNEVVTLTYNNKSYTITITVVNPTQNQTTYALNKASVDYTIGNNFNDLGIYLVDTQNADNKVAVTLNMLQDATILNTAGTKTATIVYDNKTYNLTIVVNPKVITYALNKQSVSYIIGSDFADLGLCLVATNEAGISIPVTASMLKQSSVLNTECQNVTAVVVYQGLEYEFTITVINPNNANEMKSKILDFLQRYDALNNNGVGSASLNINLTSTYLGEEDKIEQNMSTDLQSDEYLLNAILGMIKQNIVHETSDLDKLEIKNVQALTATFDLINLYNSFKNKAENLELDTVKNFVKQIIDIYVLTESDSYYIDYLVETIGETFEIEIYKNQTSLTTGGAKVIGFVTKCFNNFKNITWENFNIDLLKEFINIVEQYSIEEKLTDSINCLNQIIQKAESSELNSLSDILNCFKSINYVTVYKSDDSKNSEFVRYNAYEEQINTTSANNLINNYFDNCINIVKVLEGIIAGDEVQTSLETLKTKLNSLQNYVETAEQNFYQLNCIFISRNIVYEDEFLNQSYIISDERIGLFTSYKIDSIVEIIDELVDVCKQSDSDNNVNALTYYIAKNYIINPNIRENFVYNLCQAFMIDEYSECYEELLETVDSYVNNIESFDYSNFIKDVCGLLIDNTPIFENYDISEDQADLIRDVIKKVIEGNDLNQIIKDDDVKTELSNTIGQMIANVLGEEENSTAVVKFQIYTYNQLTNALQNNFEIQSAIESLVEIIIDYCNEDTSNVVTAITHYIDSLNKIASNQMSVVEFLQNNPEVLEYVILNFNSETMQEVATVVNKIFKGESLTSDEEELLTTTICTILNIDQDEDEQTDGYKAVYNILNTQIYLKLHAESTIDYKTLINNLWTVTQQYSYILNNENLSEEYRNLLIKFIDTLLQEKDIIDFVSENKTSLSNALTELTLLALDVDSDNYDDYELSTKIYYLSQLTNIIEENFNITSALDNLYNLVSEFDCYNYQVQQFILGLTYTTSNVIKISEGQFTLKDFIIQNGYVDMIVSYVESYCEEYEIEFTNSDKNLLKNLLNAILYNNEPTYILNQNKQVLGDKISDLLVNILQVDCDDVYTYADAYYKINTFVLDQINDIICDTLDTTSLISEFLTLVNQVGSNQVKTNINAIAFASIFTYSELNNIEIDYNEMFKNVELPEYIDSVDYNKLINNITSGKVITDMLSVKTSEVKYVTNSQGDIVKEVITYTINVNYDFLFIKLQGDITFTIEIACE